MIIISLIGYLTLMPLTASIEDLYFLEGLWINEESLVYEEWKIHESRLVGHSYRYEGSIKVFLESLEIFQNDDGEIFMIADVVTNETPVPFKLIDDSKGYVFENPEHDYPKRITYLKTKKGIQAIIEGENGENTRKFNFKKVS